MQFRSVSCHGTGGVDEDIRMAELVPDRFEGSLNGFGVGDVESICQCFDGGVGRLDGLFGSCELFGIRS